MHAIFQSLPGLIEELSNDGSRAAIVAAIWPNVIGEHLREQSAATQLDEGILRVAVSDPEWKREFEEQAAHIVFKLNRALNSVIVRRIDFTVDRKLVDHVVSRKKQKQEPRIQTSVPRHLKISSAKIADVELRTNFLEAAAACIQRRDAK